MNAFSYISISMLVNSSIFQNEMKPYNNLCLYRNLPSYVLFDVYALSRGKLTFIQLSNNKYANSVLWSIVQMHFSGEFRVDEIPCSVFAVI